MGKRRRVKFLTIGRLAQRDVTARWGRDKRVRIPSIEKAIEKTWATAIRKPGITLFDAPLCRLESFRAGSKLELNLSRTSYKVFFGTNLNSGRTLAARYGPEVLADSIGITSVLETSDGFLLLGRRNRTVAHYGSRVHPFGGMLEPARRVDVFAEMRRELAEELNFTARDEAEMFCLGLVEDGDLLQPELIFATRSTRTSRQIRRKLDQAEHDAAVAIRISRGKVASAVAEAALTPVAAAILLAWGRCRWGDAWFDEAARAVTLEAHESR
jgi:8-oxo-dGTP pyrophosphatase MutT (NUDIX family)